MSVCVLYPWLHASHPVWVHVVYLVVDEDAAVEDLVHDVAGHAGEHRAEHAAHHELQPVDAEQPTVSRTFAQGASTHFLIGILVRFVLSP